MSTVETVMDDYSRYPVVEIVKLTAVTTTIPKLDKVFSEFGVPDVIGPRSTAKRLRHLQMTSVSSIVR